MTTSWNHLPNAAHIDRVLTSLKSRPEHWCSYSWDRVGSANVSNKAAWPAINAAARNTVWYDVRDVADDVPTVVGDSVVSTWAAKNACRALIAWDNCAYLLDADPEHVKVLALLGVDAAIALYPACVVLHKEMEIA